jgi:YHS domain-containing protein
MTAFLLKVIIVLLVVRALWRLVGGLLKGLGDGSALRTPGGASPVALSRDPICGTYVVPERALPLRDGPLVRYFCSERCRDEFARTPPAAHETPRPR